MIYNSKDGRESRSFSTLDWLAKLVTHVPNKWEQMVRYYGYYSNKSRGIRKKEARDDSEDVIIDETPVSKKMFRKNWARLIQKIYQVDPLLCKICKNEMRIISFIEKPDVIKKILQHLGLWDIRNTGPPEKPSPTYDIPELTYDNAFSQEIPDDFYYWS